MTMNASEKFELQRAKDEARLALLATEHAQAATVAAEKKVKQLERTVELVQGTLDERTALLGAANDKVSHLRSQLKDVSHDYDDLLERARGRRGKRFVAKYLGNR